MGIPQSQQTAWLALHFVKNAALSFSNWRVVLRTLDMCHRLVVLRTVFAICASSFGVSFSSDLYNYRYYVTIVISAKERR